MMRRLILAGAFLACAAAAAQAQEKPLYTETGAVKVTLAGSAMTLRTASNTVPGEAGRKVHGASWIVLAPRLMGGVNISPDDVFVTFTAHKNLEPAQDTPSLKVTFSPDPKTFALKTRPEPEVIYFPGGDAAPHAVRGGIVDLEHVTRTAPDVFAIQGKITGEVDAIAATSGATPAGPIPISVSFDLERVVNRGPHPLP